MAIVNTNFIFTAQAESVVTWGRALTSEESISLQTKKGAMMSAGSFGSFPSTSAGTSTFQWVTSDAANEWVAFCNTFTPAPSSATVVLLEEPTP